MIYHIIPAVVVATLIVIGHVIKRKRIASYNKRAEFTVDFNNTFFDFVNEVFTTRRMNSEKYNAVMKDVDKIQEELGMDGVLNEFVDPLRGIQGRNYQLFMNSMGEGIRWIVGLPVDVLQWAGLYSTGRSRKIKASVIFKAISNFIVFIGLISSIVTIVLGWDEFLEIINNRIGRK